MRRVVATIGVLAGLVAFACDSEAPPKSVDAHWVNGCEASGAETYGLTREHACLAAGKGYEDDGDLGHATVFYKRGCDLGYGEGCVAWARVLVARGNVTGARFVLSSSPACDTSASAAKCGWALVASLERDEPTRPSEIPPALHVMCDRHHVPAACKRLALVEEPARLASAVEDDAGADAGAKVTVGTRVPAAGRPAGCHALSDCVQFDLMRDEGSCAGSMQVNVTNKCNERVYCAWCQSRGTQIVDRSTCGSHWFEVDQTYRGAVNLCDRGVRGDDVVYTCAAANDAAACTRL